MPDDRSQYEGRRPDTLNYSNIRSDTPWYRAIPRGIANVGRYMAYGPPGRSNGVNMLRDRIRGRDPYRRKNRNGSR